MDYTKWNTIKLKYAYHFSTGFTPNTNNFSYYSDTGYSWVQISDLSQKYISSTTKHITSQALEDYHPKISPKGSLLIGFKLSLGSVSFCQMDTYTNEAIASFPPDNVNSLDYLYYLFPCTAQ